MLHALSGAGIAAGTVSAGFDIIVIDASGRFLHLRLELSEPPTDADAEVAGGVFAFAPRAEGISQRFAAVCLVFLEDIAGVDGDIQSIFFQERAAQPDAIEMVGRAFALQRDTRCAASAIETEAQFPRQGLLDIPEQVALPSVVVAGEGVALIVGIRAGGIDGDARFVARIPIRPERQARLLRLADIAVSTFHHAVVHERVAFDAIIDKHIAERRIQAELRREATEGHA